MQRNLNRRRRVNCFPVAALQELEERCLLAVAVPGITGPTAISNAFPQIEWTAAATARHYQIHIDNLTTGERRVVGESNIATTSYTVAEGLPTGDYRVWVKGFSDTESSVWSQPFDFRVESDVLPNPLATDSVSFEDIGSQLRITWSSAFWADSYEIEIRSQSDAIGQVLRTADVTDSFFLIPYQLPVGTYHAWVRGANSNGMGPWSNAASITIAGEPEIPSTPQLTVQADFTQDSPLEILWSNHLAPAFMEIHINDVTGQQFRVHTLRNQLGYRIDLNSGLPTGRYRLWGQLSSEAGMSSWSDPVDFQVGDSVTLPLPAKPVIQFSGTAVPETRPVIVWSDDAHSVRYEIWIDITSKQHDGPWFYTSSHNGNRFVPKSGFEPGQSYKLWVRGFNESNVHGEWSDPVSFEIADTIPVPEQPVLPTFSGTFLTPRPILKWNRLSAAESYQVWLSDLTLGHQIELAENHTDTSFSPSHDLTVGHDYRLWIRAANHANEFGEWSVGSTFKVRDRKVDQVVEFGSGIPFPWCILPDPESDDHAFVLSGTGETGPQSLLGRINLNTFELTTELLPVGQNGSALAYVDGYIIVASRGSDRIHVINRATWQVLPTHYQVKEPTALSVLPDGNIVVGSLYDTTRILSLNDGVLSEVAKSTGYHAPYSLTVDHEHNRIYLNGYTTRAFFILDASTLDVVARLDVEGIPSYGGSIWNDFYVGTDKDGYIHLINRTSFEHQRFDLAALMNLDRSTLPDAGIDPNSVVVIDDTHLFVVQGRQESVLLEYSHASKTLNLIQRGPGAMRGLWRPQLNSLLLWTSYAFQSLVFNAERTEFEKHDRVGSSSFIVNAGMHQHDALRTIVFSSSDYRVRSVDVATGSITQHTIPSQSTTFAPNLHALESASQSQRLLIVTSLQGRYRLARVNNEPEVEIVSNLRLQTPISMRVSDSTIAIVDRLHNEVEFIDRVTGKQQVVTLGKYRSRVGTFLPGGEFVVVHDTNPDVGVSVISNGTVKYYPQEYTRWLSEIVTIDQDRVALLAYNGSVRLFNIRTGRVERTIALPYDRPTDIEIVGNNMVIASPSRGKTMVVDMTTDEVTEIWDTPFVTSLISDDNSVWAVSPFNLSQRVLV